MSDPRRLVVFTGDTHAGGTPAALRKPIVTDQGQEVRPSELNLLLAGKKQECAEWAAEKARKYGSAGADVQGSVPTVVLHNGDGTEGKHHRTYEVLIPEQTGYQLEVLCDLLSIYNDTLKPVAWMFTRGTEAHVGTGGELEIGAAKILVEKGWPVRVHPDTGSLVPQAWEFRAGGHLIWAAHHGKIGRLPNTKGSQANLFAVQTFLQESLDNWNRVQVDGEDPQAIPRLIVGSHHHQKADSGPHYPLRAIQLPCWTFRNSHAHKVAAFSREDIGLAAVYCDPDEPDPIVHWKLWQPRRSSEVIDV